MADDQKLDPRQIQRLLLDTRRGRRFTQDSPILPDVWIAYADRGVERLDLLITPHWDSTTHEVARRLETRLEVDRARPAWSWWTERIDAPERSSPAIAYNGSAVAARLRLDELVRAVLPMTEWWDEHVWRDNVERLGEIDQVLADPSVVRRLARELVDPTLPMEDDEYPDPIPEQLVWMLRLVGVVVAQRAGKNELVTTYLGSERDAAPPQPGASTESWEEWSRHLAGRREAARQIVEQVAHLFRDTEKAPHADGGLLPAGDDEPRIYSVHRNRPATISVAKSTLAVKADAARQLFSIDASPLAWAVIDSGVDATHPAFAGRQEDGSLKRKEDGRFPTLTSSRVEATYDFSLIRYILSSDHGALGSRIAELQTALDQGGGSVPRARSASWQAELETLERLEGWFDGTGDRAETAKALRTSLQSGRAIDWNLLGELLRIPHDDDYRRPLNNHGTHVAGILAGDWRRADQVGRIGREDLVGVAPTLRLYDLRVLGADGTGDEFAVIAALQFLRHLNVNKDFVVVHGANLSLSIRHEVINYACGATPVCEEAERLVSSGVVVVAAAGNRGYTTVETTDGPSESYQSISITDPGNAEGVLTVGATHRSSPHTYGVSYFSSRGPTGDGRAKPDLVAPGEKIVSSIPGEGGDPPGRCLLDGTSMAAPHVSGVAALLLARHRELAGKPQRVKEILTATATDLGRERYFQGAGMVDALRALQSI